MSKANRLGKELARQRAQQLRIEQARRQRRNRQFMAYGAAGAVIIVATLIAVLVQVNQADAALKFIPTAAVADTTGGISQGNAMAIPEGSPSAGAKLTVYEDFRCSACGQFEATYHTTYEQLVKAGTLEIFFHPVNLIDTMDNSTGLNTSGSIHAGNAAACAQDAGKFQAYHDVLYANQPAETNDAFSSDATLINYAKQVPGLDTPAFRSCVDSHKYFTWIQRNYSDLNQIDNGQAATPTLLLNGKKYTLPTTGTVAQRLAAFTAAIDKAAGVSPSASASASASSSSAAGPSPSPSASSTASASASASTSPTASASPAPSSSAS